MPWGRATTSGPAAQSVDCRQRSATPPSVGLGSVQLPCLRWPRLGADDTGVDFRAQIEASMDEVEASAIVGSADQVADELAQYDVDLVIARIGYDQPPRSALTEVIERIGTELVGMVA